ncbi:monocarboxylate transporter 3 [Eurytemora carolleeae]|uniref:monocarboxylate transporter 3 n=1 Tax=Eurytemora carolleeae TaxID=1294199 RepID=UPI000C765F84|nr:monocarboxylate transporter 3 [Eurytemora carolleeae]|eukprot:XP_023323773.1 monocarboxylate transporter 3-like [Eurytemora affinis]
MGQGGQEAKEQEADVAAENMQKAEDVKLVVKKSKMEDPGAPPPPPDGGWGWVVVAASFLCNMVLDGIAYSFGILLTPLMLHFGEGKGLVSLVGSVLAGVIMLVGPVASFLVNKYGPRLVPFQTPNTNTCSMARGFGLGMMYVPAVVAVGYWFEKRRSLVTGISTCGSGAGTIVFAPLVTALEGSFGWTGCNRILAGLCLMCVLFGATMKPVPRKPADEEDDDSITELKKENKMKELGPYAEEEIAFMDGNNETKVLAEPVEAVVQTQSKPKSGIKTLMTNPAFMMIMVANLPAVMGLYIPYMFLPSVSAVTDHPKIDALLVTCFALFFGKEWDSCYCQIHKHVE